MISATKVEAVTVAMPRVCLSAATALLSEETFADRGYRADGSLVPRGMPGALVADPGEAARRACRMVTEGRVASAGGADVLVMADTICVHGDEPGALSRLREIVRSFREAGIAVRRFGIP